MRVLYMCSLVADETYSEIPSCGHYNTEILNASSTLQSSGNRIKQYMYTSLLNWLTICLFQMDKSQGWNLLLNVKNQFPKSAVQEVPWREIIIIPWFQFVEMILNLNIQDFRI